MAESAVGGVLCEREGVSPAAAARVELPAESAWIRCWTHSRDPQRERVLPRPPQQGVRFPVAQPQAGGVRDQMQHGEVVYD